MHFAIIGAGMAGLACADALAKHGHRSTLFDKGRGPGGRMSTRRADTQLGPVRFDHGAQYFTARDKRFKMVVANWQSQGLALPWPVVGPDAWVGVPGMNAVIKRMISDHDVAFGHLVRQLTRAEGKWFVASDQGSAGPFDAVVIALPAEQAAVLLSLHDFPMAQDALLARSQPCWSAMFAFADRLPAKCDIVRDNGIVAWAARNSSKPGRTGPEAWVVQATSEWSSAHLEQASDGVAESLRTALSGALGVALPPTLIAQAHRWRFALSAGTGRGSMWNRDLRLGACGDWLLGPRVECAWLSGDELGRRVAIDAAGWLPPCNE